MHVGHHTALPYFIRVCKLRLDAISIDVAVSEFEGHWVGIRCIQDLLLGFFNLIIWTHFIILLLYLLSKRVKHICTIFGFFAW